VLLSSLAECVYWFGRYIERTESTARLILVHDSLLLDIPRQCHPGWSSLIHVTGGAEAFLRDHPEPAERDAIRHLVLDCEDNPGAMLNSIVRARENLRATCALFPQPAWEVVNGLYEYVMQNGPDVLDRKDRYRFLRRVIDHCHLLAGKLAISMSHDEIYEFVRMGFNLERADMTSRVIDVRSHNLLQTHDPAMQPFDDILWKSVLDSLAAWQMYRRFAQLHICSVEVLRFLLQDRRFPRAIGHCLAQLDESLYALAVDDTPRHALAVTRRMVANADIPALAGKSLHGFIGELQRQFSDVHGELSARYFGGDDDAPAAVSAGTAACKPRGALPYTFLEEVIDGPQVTTVG
jgi:uncharacterized alpha-E superfamily protein